MFVTLISFFFVLSLLVVVHELGHYTVAKLGGIGVERFSIGYPPRLWGIKIGETDYCISAVPFGGYVKLHGQDDFATPDEYTADPRDYRSKHPLLKIAVLVAGSLMNIVTAVVIFAILFTLNGAPVTTNRIGYVKPGALADSLGLQIGDVVTSVQGREIDDLDEILLPMFMNDSITFEVLRGTERFSIVTRRKLEQEEEFGAAPHTPARISTVLTASAADQAGILPGDLITAVDGMEVDGWYDMSAMVRERPGRETTITVERDGQPVVVTATIETIEEETADGVSIIGRLGVTPVAQTRDVGGIEAWAMSLEYTGYLITHMLDFFGKLVTGQLSSKLLGGPVMIAQMAGESAKSGFSTLMSFTAFISINLGVLNLLPFPVLDGGHVFILLIEMVTRRKVSERVKIALQQVGSLVLLFLMLYITFNDVMRFEMISRLFGG